MVTNTRRHNWNNRNPLNSHVAARQHVPTSREAHYFGAHREGFPVQTFQSLHDELTGRPLLLPPLLPSPRNLLLASRTSVLRIVRFTPNLLQIDAFQPTSYLCHRPSCHTLITDPHHPSKALRRRRHHYPTYSYPRTIPLPLLRKHRRIQQHQWLLLFPCLLEESAQPLCSTKLKHASCLGSSTS